MYLLFVGVTVFALLRITRAKSKVMSQVNQLDKKQVLRFQTGAVGESTWLLRSLSWSDCEEPPRRGVWAMDLKNSIYRLGRHEELEGLIPTGLHRLKSTKLYLVSALSYL